MIPRTTASGTTIVVFFFEARLFVREAQGKKKTKFLIFVPTDGCLFLVRVAELREDARARGCH